MTECSQQTFGFQALGSRRVEADFSGGHLSSDGGVLLLRETDRHLGLCDKLARCFSDTRDTRFVEHSLPVMIRQRLLGLALGYEDLNDHEQLRTVPWLAAACENPDLLGQNRRHERDLGKALAGKSTLNRLELGAVAKSTGKYRKIHADADAIRDLLLEEGIKAIPRKSRVIVLDFDATDDPIHGNQEGRFFHGYYRNYCYLPLYCFCGDIPLWAQLRTSDRDGSDGTLEALQHIIPAIRKQLGDEIKIIIRGDSGFCRDELMTWIEDQPSVHYVLGLARNNRLEKLLAPTFEALYTSHTSACEAARSEGREVPHAARPVCRPHLHRAVCRQSIAAVVFDLHLSVSIAVARYRAARHGVGQSHGGHDPAASLQSRRNGGGERAPGACADGQRIPSTRGLPAGQCPAEDLNNRFKQPRLRKIN